jgi:hypothetical protein
MVVTMARHCVLEFVSLGICIPKTTFSSVCTIPIVRFRSTKEALVMESVLLHSLLAKQGTATVVESASYASDHC